LQNKIKKKFKKISKIKSQKFQNKIKKKSQKFQNKIKKKFNKKIHINFKIKSKKKIHKNFKIKSKKKIHKNFKIKSKKNSQKFRNKIKKWPMTRHPSHQLSFVPFYIHHVLQLFAFRDHVHKPLGCPALLRPHLFESEIFKIFVNFKNILRLLLTHGD